LEFNRKAVNEEAALCWDKLVKDARLSNTPISQMSNRAYKPVKREFSMPEDKALEHVSDVMMTFLEKSDEKVERIVSGDGDVYNYLRKCVMMSVMSTRSSVNYKKLGERITDSYDAPLKSDEDGRTILDLLQAPVDCYTSFNLLEIIEEALVGQSKEDIYVFNRTCRDDIKVTEFIKEKGIDMSYQTALRIKHHMTKIVMIYCSTEEVQERVKEILS
jgi:hypothetical protein